MTLGIYSLFDSVAETFGDLSVDRSDATARRNFASAVAESSRLQYISKDLILYKVGEFDLQTGQIIPCVPLVQIVKGVEVMPSA